MRKAIVVELVHHHECIENAYRYLKNQGYDVTLLVGEYVYNAIKETTLIKKSKFEVLPQPQRKSIHQVSGFQKIFYFFSQWKEIYSCIRLIKQKIKHYYPDLIYLNTVESPFLVPMIIYFLKKHQFKLYTVIHNTNRLRVGFIKYISFDFLIKRLIKKSDGIVLLGKYLRFTNQSIQNKVVYLNNRSKKLSLPNKFKKKTFVISGTMNTETKDIQSILKGFSTFLNINPSYQNDIQLFLLGRSDDQIERWIDFYKLRKIVRTYRQYIPEEEMERVLGKSHYAILSVYKDSIYGNYKISGSYGDAESFGLPILLSHWYAPGFKDPSIIRFENDSFHTTLATILQG